MTDSTGAAFTVCLTITTGHPPDRDFELLLSRHQEVVECLIGLIEANQKNLLHVGHLLEMPGKASGIADFIFLLASLPDYD